MSEVKKPADSLLASDLKRCPRADCGELVPKDEMAEHMETAHDRSGGY